MSCSTLRRHIKDRRAKAGRPPVLKEKEEEYLVDYVESVDGESVNVGNFRFGLLLHFYVIDRLETKLGLQIYYKCFMLQGQMHWD